MYKLRNTQIKLSLHYKNDNNIVSIMLWKSYEYVETCGKWSVLAMDYQLWDMWKLDNEISVYRDLLPFKPSHY